ncbi:hypothetical protein [Flavipsychrobacter stenotrophus]|uniref:hypothetical protein n=1 Tax=Flavipsychrobacter stenotrophus TaxID=2077091 RepID=UPI0010573535|nr:hypothetical protein [Flavipsychrobacter stenotrophus]
MNSAIVTLANNIDRPNALQNMLAGRSNNELNRDKDNFSSFIHNGIQQADESAGQTAGRIKKYTEVIKTASEGVKTISEAGSSIEGLAGYMAKLKGVAGTIGSIAGVLDGVEKLDASKDNISKIKSIIEILGSAATAGENASVMGPAAAVFATGTSLAVGLYDWQRRQIKDPYDVPQTNFVDKGLKYGNNSLAAVHATRDHASYIASLAKQKSPEQIQNEAIKLADVWLAKGGDILFNDDMAANNPAYSIGLAMALNRNNAMSKPAINKVLFDDPGEEKAFKKNFDSMGLFRTESLPLVLDKWRDPYGIANFKKERYVSRKQMRERYAPRKTMGNITLDDIQNKYLTDLIQGYEQYGNTYVTNAIAMMDKQHRKDPYYQKSKVTVLEQFDRAKKIINEESKQAPGGTSNNYQQRGNTGNTINFNKALIVHFTINVKDSKEGMNDFKRKVEEVLIEILHSVNTIH